MLLVRQTDLTPESVKTWKTAAVWKTTERLTLRRRKYAQRAPHSSQLHRMSANSLYSVMYR